ncbi:hypothetical protein [Janibacter melonis]|nr:hypothetical protein [Janibacter melonis]
MEDEVVLGCTSSRRPKICGSSVSIVRFELGTIIPMWRVVAEVVGKG